MINDDKQSAGQLTIGVAPSHAASLKVPNALPKAGEVAAQPSTTPTPVAESQKPRILASVRNPLLRYSLAGDGNTLGETAVKQLPLLGNLSLCGEIGVWYAPPNTGKTLFVLHLAIEAVMQKRIAAGSVFYVNVDDSLMGVAEKVQVLDDFGVHALATGQKGFKPSSLIPAMEEMVRTKTAHGTLIILDTMKKVLDLMNKKEAREFGLQAREFAMAGGSLVALAHTNKNRGANQKLVHAGTSDIVEDFDSAYLLDFAAAGQQPNERVVRFECIKNRGGSALEAFYAYSTVDGLSYAQRLATVRQVDPEYGENADDIRQMSEQAIIEAIRAAINAGRTKKMEIVSLVTMATKASRAVVLALLEARTGPSSEGALWDFERKARGAHVFFLHPEPPTAGEDPGEADASDLVPRILKCTQSGQLGQTSSADFLRGQRCNWSPCRSSQGECVKAASAGASSISTPTSAPAGLRGRAPTPRRYKGITPCLRSS